MKKILLSFAIYLFGAISGYLYFENQTYGLSKLLEDRLSQEMSMLNSNEFISAINPEWGKPIAVQGIVQEVYTNNKKELVIHIRHKDIPIDINCTLPNADTQIKEPLKLGQEINIEGLFSKLDKKILLKSCRLLQTETNN